MKFMETFSRLVGAGFLLALWACSSAAQSGKDVRDSMAVTYHFVQIDGVNVFYREAGPKDAPAILLLHGFPSSSRMFDPLFPLLADKYHLIAPDYPGFGHSEAPPPEKFQYTFEHLANIVDRLTETLRLTKYTMYMSDYGGPIGYRLALAHPDRVAALIVQNAVAHDDGLEEKIWAPRRAFWADRASHEDRVRAGLMSAEIAKMRHLGNSPHPDRYNPDLWTDEAAFLARPGMAQIQIELFYDYRSNVEQYPAYQEYLREKKPPTLVLWGRYDPNFSVRETDAIRRDVPNAQINILQAGHFALDEACAEIAILIRKFMG
ncbi:alpha/beta fold hydrolase [Bradyrhizobium sp. USDA 4452]